MIRLIRGITVLVFIYISLNCEAKSTYYIDSKSGNDNNSGMSQNEAWQTFRHVNQKEFQAGDQILLKKGSLWTDAFLSPKGSGTESEPILIGTYGDGEKPIINGNGLVKAAVYLRNQSNWTIEGLEITNSAPERGDVYRSGILVENDNGGALQNIRITDNYVHKVTSSFRYFYTFHPHQFGGIAVNVQGENPTDKFVNVLIENNKVENVGRTGIVVWDHKFAEYDQASQKIVIRKNYVKNIDSDGILTYGCDGALIEHNVAEGCGAYREDGQFNGAAAIWCTRGSSCIIQYNEAFNTHALEGNDDGTGFDIDMDAIDCIVQYNYSHDNEGGFMLFVDASRSSGSIVRYNISQNDATRIFMIAGGVTPNTQIYNNTIYIKEGLDTKIIDHTWDDGGDVDAPWFFKNNLIYNYGTGGFNIPGTGGIISHNAYFTKQSKNDLNDLFKVTKDPQAVNPGSGKQGIDSLGGYKLKKGSPAIMKGTVIDHNGGRDFFGNTVKVFDTPNIGASN